MPLLTVVEHYVAAAMKRAETEQLEDGTIAATVPGCPGIVAFGADSHECAIELYARLEEWVKVSLMARHPLPVIDGIDLNVEANQILATYDNGATSSEDNEFYIDEQALEAAFDRRRKPA
ncbi:MAG: type II toxin-antitoxin system HicB family antitoxin [Dehalococcoidia bacterium]